MVAGVDDLFAGAVEPGGDIGEYRRSMRAFASIRRPRNGPRPGGRRCSRRPFGLGEDIDGEARRLGQGREIARGARQADQEQRRVERDTEVKELAVKPIGLAGRSCVVTTVTPVRKAPNASRSARGIESRSCFHLRSTASPTVIALTRSGAVRLTMCRWPVDQRRSQPARPPPCARAMAGSSWRLLAGQKQCRASRPSARHRHRSRRRSAKAA